jgi:hypothetical protein
LCHDIVNIVCAGINNVLAATQKDVMGVITLEDVEEDGVCEIPVVARQVTWGWAGPKYLAVACLWWWWRTLSENLNGSLQMQQILIFQC